MDTMSYIIGRNSAGGGSGSTPSWSDITGKPFSTVDSDTGLTTTGDVLSIDTTEIATRSYVNTAMTPYVQSSSLASVATSGDYDDLSNKPTIPQPTSVSVTQTLQSGTAIADIDVDGVTTTLYAPAGGGSVDWADVTNKPAIRQGSKSNAVVEGDNNNSAEAYYSHAEGLGTSVAVAAIAAHVEGSGTIAGSAYQHVQGKYNVRDNNSKYVDIVGNGTVSYEQSNAEATSWTGNKYLAGDIYVNVTNWTNPEANSVKLEPVSIANAITTGVAIADIQIGAATTTLYAPSSATGVTPNWNATSGQDGYIENKPAVMGNDYGSVAIGTSNNIGFLPRCSAIGYNNNIAGGAMGTFAIGQNNSASSGGYAIGANNNINNSNAFLFGLGLETGAAATQARGKWNITNGSFLDTLGNGTGDNARSNAEATDMSGNKYLAGDVYVGVTDWTDPQNNSVKLAPVPTAPTTAGTYTLQVVVDASGNPTYSWI